MSVNEEGKIADDQFKNKETKYAGFATFRLSVSQWKGSIGLSYEYIHAINTDQGEVKNKTNYSDLLPSLVAYVSVEHKHSQMCIRDRS